MQENKLLEKNLRFDLAMTSTLKFMSYQGGNLIKTMKIAMETFIEKT